MKLFHEIDEHEAQAQHWISQTQTARMLMLTLSGVFGPLEVSVGSNSFGGSRYSVTFRSDKGFRALEARVALGLLGFKVTRSYKGADGVAYEDWDNPKFNWKMVRCTFGHEAGQVTSGPIGGGLRFEMDINL